MSNKTAPMKPAPKKTRGDGARYIAPHCPACGEYPGGEGYVTCQHCGERVYAKAQWDGADRKGPLSWLFGG